MQSEIKNKALAILTSRDYWQPIMRETPVFVNGEGPFLIRGERLMPISYRAAWALLRSDLTTDDGRPVKLMTYSSGLITDETIKMQANHLKVL